MVAVWIVNIVFAVFVVVGMLTLLIGAIFKDKELAVALARRHHRRTRVRPAHAPRRAYARPQLGTE